MDWQRLDRKATEDLIQKAGSASVLFSPQTSEARRATLSFLDNYALYRLTNYAALPMISLDYLVNENTTTGGSVFYLDGSTAPLFHAIRNDTFNLSDETVISYVNFFYKNAPDPDGDIYIIQDLESLVFFDLLENDQQALLQSNFTAPQIHPYGDGSIEIKACLVYQGSLVKADVFVSKDGSVKINNIQMMLRSTPAYHKMDS